MQSFPLMGVSREKLAPGLRVLFHRDHAVYYLPQIDEIVIVRVLHGARDVASLAERGEFVF